MATETGMLHPLQMARPDIDFVAANEAATCRYMKMITLPKLRDALRYDVARGEGARGDRRARPAADRADGRDRLSDFDGDDVDVAVAVLELRAGQHVALLDVGEVAARVLVVAEVELGLLVVVGRRWRA